MRIVGGRTGDDRDKDPTLSTSGHYARGGGLSRSGNQGNTFRPFSTLTPSGREISVSVTKEMHSDSLRDEGYGDHDDMAVRSLRLRDGPRILTASSFCR